MAMYGYDCVWLCMDMTVYGLCMDMTVYVWYGYDCVCMDMTVYGYVWI